LSFANQFAINDDLVGCVSMNKCVAYPFEFIDNY